MGNCIVYIQEQHPNFTESFLRAEINELYSRNYDVAVVTPKIIPECLNECAYREHIFASTWSDDPTIKLDNLTAEVKKQNPRYLHSHFITEAKRYTLPVAERLNIPFGFMVHAYDIWLRGARIEPEEINRIANHPLCVIAACEGSKHRNYLLWCGVPEEKIIVTPNCVDERCLPEPKTQYANSVKKIMAVGRPVIKKGFFVAIDALRLLHLRGYNEMELEIVFGSDLQRDLAPILMQYAKNFPFIRFTPKTPHPQILQKIKDADVLIMPCIVSVDGDSDGIPTVLSEAMLLGTPVICTDVGSVTDLVIPEKTGFLARVGDSASLAERITDVDSLLKQTTELTQLIARAKRQAAKHSALSSVNSLAKHLEIVLGRFC
ncbi:MAG: glycosyltransferase [Deltaproteobacteria bacterium]|nr:glycosyltransferase [Deltaproteobacteria bacterium]